MKFRFKPLLLCLFSFTALAEHSTTAPPPKAEPEVQVYTKTSADAVETLNKATEVLRDPVKVLTSTESDNKSPAPAVSDNNGAQAMEHNNNQLLRDPTQVSGNFRQELKKMSQSSGTAGSAAANAPGNGIPMIEVAAKIIGKHKSVLLRVNGHTTLVSEGGQVSLVEKNQVLSFRVDRITQNQVQIFVLPYNEHLILQ